MSKKVTKLIYGCAPLGVYDMGKIILSDVMTTVEEAFDLGITSFDCADIYGLGAAERNLSKALGSKIKKAHIITKYGISWRQKSSDNRVDTFRNCSKEYMVKALDASLKRLGCEQIDTYFVHWPDGKTSLSEITDSLEAVKKSGKICSYGFSNFPIKTIKNSIIKEETAPSWFQAEYSLLCDDKDLEDLQNLKKQGIGIMGYGGLAQGYLSGKFKIPPKFETNDRRIRMKHFKPNFFLKNKYFLNILENIAKEEGLTMSQTAISWCIQSGNIDSIIVGIKNHRQLIELINLENKQISEHNFIKLNNARLSLIKKTFKDHTSH